jgi:hypothetical protein
MEMRVQTNDKEMAGIKQKILDDNQRKEQAVWAGVMSTTSGRMVMWQLMEEFGLFGYCFDGNGQKMAEKTAKQGCAQYIKNRIAFWCGGEVWTMMEYEAMQRAKQDDSELERKTKELEIQRKGR